MPIILNSEGIEESIPGWATVAFVLIFVLMVTPLIIMIWGVVYEEYLKDFILKLKRRRRDEEEAE